MCETLFSVNRITTNSCAVSCGTCPYVTVTCLRLLYGRYEKGPYNVVFYSVVMLRFLNNFVAPSNHIHTRKEVRSVFLCSLSYRTCSE
jgi:hypothetical protein